MEPSSIKRIFFYRICGTGMGACAHLFKQKGFIVAGADSKFLPPMSTFLKSTGIPTYPLDEIKCSDLEEYDLIVVGNVVKEKSEDVSIISNAKVPLLSYPQALGQYILPDMETIVGLAGTHGKTTTSYLMVQLFEKLGETPGYFIGGVIEGRNSSHLGAGKYFFIEADEYDSAYFDKVSKFRHYLLNYLILTSLEFDHADIFKDLESIKDQFRKVMPSLTGGIFNTSFKAADDLYQEFAKGQKHWHKYGESETGPVIIKSDNKGSEFSLHIEGKKHHFFTNLIGLHNIQNLSSCILFAATQGLEIEKIKNVCLDFKMVQRRQWERGTFKEALVIDDFAHHPRAVSSTIETMKIKYPSKKLLVVLEPNSATGRSDIFQNEFENALKQADKVVLAKPSTPTTVKGRGNLDCHKIAIGLTKNKTPAYVVEDLKELRAILDKEACKKMVFLILSNGTCLGLWESDFENCLQK